MNVNRSETPRRRRRGYTMLELTLAVVLLMAAMGVMVRVLAWVGVERRAADRRLWAVQEASNVMERIAAEPFDRVTSDRAGAIAAGADAGRALPGAAWDADVRDDPAAPVAAKRVSLRLRWHERSGGWGGPVRLTSWVYRRRASS